MIIFSWSDFSLEDVGTLPKNSYNPSPGPMRSYIVKENHIGSPVSEMDPSVLQTDTHIDRYTSYYFYVRIK